MRKLELSDCALDPPDDEPEIPSSGIQPNFDRFFDWVADLKAGSLEHSVLSKAIKEQSAEAWYHALELLQAHIDREAHDEHMEKAKYFYEEVR